MEYCKLCNNYVLHLARHIKKEHKNYTLQQYYDLYLKKSENDGKCLCCGNKTQFYNLRRGYAQTCSYSCGAKIGQNKRYLNPDEHEKAKIRSKTYYDNHPELKQYLSLKQKERFKNQEERQRLSIILKNSKIHDEKIHSSEYHNKMHNILIERYKSPEAREKMSYAVKNSQKAYESKHTTEFRQKHSIIMHERIKNGNINVNYIFENVRFRSLPEFCFYIYLKDHKIRFKYQSIKIPYYDENNIMHYYLPDFIIFNTIVEIKGPHLLKDGHLWDPFTKTFSTAKEQCMLNNNVKVFTEEKYIKYINYIMEKYGYNFILLHRVNNKNIDLKNDINKINKKYMEQKPEQPSMMSMFPAEELKRMMLHLDRFDTEVVTDERINAEKALDNLDEVSEKIIEADM